MTPALMAKLRRKRLREMTTEKFFHEDTSSDDGEVEEQQFIRYSVRFASLLILYIAQTSTDYDEIEISLA